MKDTTFRRFKKLTEEEKKIYTKSELEPDVKCLAIKYHKLTSRHIKRCLRWAEKNYSIYIGIASKCKFTTKRFLKPSTAERELLFRGFIPLLDFKCKEKYGYIKTNGNTKGTELIYPKHFGYWGETTRKQGNEIYQEFHKYGLLNYTMVHTIKPAEWTSKTKR